MPRYGDDQCKECGGIRVAKSSLCVDCLVIAFDREREKNKYYKNLINNRDLKVGELKALLNNAINYGYKKNQEIVKLHCYIKELNEALTRGVDDEEGGI